MFKAAHPHNAHAQLLFPEYLRQSLGPVQTSPQGTASVFSQYVPPSLSFSSLLHIQPRSCGGICYTATETATVPAAWGELGSQVACASSTARQGETSPCDGPPSPGGITSQAPPPAHKPCFWVFTPEAFSPPAVRRPFLNRSSPSIPEQEAVPVVHR